MGRDGPWGRWDFGLVGSFYGGVSNVCLLGPRQWKGRPNSIIRENRGASVPVRRCGFIAYSTDMDLEG
jgi:hypothetical protein